jgi:hypothetical protein
MPLALGRPGRVRAFLPLRIVTEPRVVDAITLPPALHAVLQAAQ